MPYKDLKEAKNHNKKYYREHKEVILEHCKQYRQEHQLEIKIRRKLYNNKHKAERIQYQTNKLKTDLNYKLARNLRTRINCALKGICKSKRTLDLLGCSLDFLRLYLQSKFQPGMSFSNYGKWHIDHIIPCARFDLSNPEEQIKCFNYTNLQPLWQIDNKIKGKRIVA